MGLLLVMPPAGGEEGGEVTGDSKEELRPYFVVSTRTLQPLDRASPSISVVTREEIEGGEYRTLEEILNRTAGMSLATTGQVGGVSSLFTRGTNSDHTVILLDGRKLNGGFSGTYNLAQLNLDNLERVEIMKGASSTLYGAEGIGGVISLFSGAVGEEEQTRLRLEGEAGSFGTYRSQVNATVGSDRAGLKLGASHLETDNQEPNSRYRITNLMARGNLRVTEALSFDFTSLFYDARSGNPDNRKAPTYPALEDFQATQTWLLSPGIKYRIDEKLHLRFFYSRSKDRLESKTSSFFLHTDSNTTTDEADLQVDWMPGDRFSLTLGTVYRNEDFLQEDLELGGTPFDNSWSSLSVYGQTRWQPLEGIHVTGGGRFDDYSDFGSPTTWNVLVEKTYSQLGLSFFGKFATAYAVPQAFDLYGLFGNPNLNAEESESREFGFRQELLQGSLRLEGIYFANDISNLITGFPLLNVGNARTEGFEFSATLKPTDRFQFYANYTHLTAEDRDTDMRLLRRPRHQGSLGIRFIPSPNFTAGFDFRFNRDRLDIDGGTFVRITAEDYSVARLYARYRIHRRIEIFGRVENLFNRQYGEVDGFKALDRGAYLGAQIMFGER